MKNIIFLLLMILSVDKGQTQSVDNIFLSASGATTLSPFGTAISVIKMAEESVQMTSILTFYTSIIPQGRGVADREQLRDELLALNEDMLAGRVSKVSEVRQKALKEIFQEIAADNSKMSKINSMIKNSSELHRLATAVTLELMLND